MADMAILEIVELSTGEVVLRPSDGEGDALISIKFSPMATQHLADSRFEIAREMIDHAIARLQLWHDADEEENFKKSITWH